MAKKKTIKPKSVKPKRKESLYQKISKRFTKYNNSLPEEQKISLDRRRQIIKQSISPYFEGTSPSKIRVRDINFLILSEIVKQPPKSPELCNPLYINPSNYAQVIWFEIDEHLQKIIPDCIYVKVSAGDFGETNIFNTRNYNYYNKGVREIVENIREYASGQSIYPYFKGYLKVRPKKKDDKKADSYYIDYILFINDEPVTEIGARIIVDRAKLTQSKRIRKKVNSIIDKQILKLTKEKSKKTNAFRTLNSNKKKLNDIIYGRTKKEKKERATAQVKKVEALLEKYKAKKVITNKQYERQLKELGKEKKKIRKL